MIAFILLAAKSCTWVNAGNDTKKLLCHFVNLMAMAQYLTFQEDIMDL